jgi:hypothetical protein
LGLVAAESRSATIGRRLDCGIEGQPAMSAAKLTAGTPLSVMLWPAAAPWPKSATPSATRTVTITTAYLHAAVDDDQALGSLFDLER